MNDLKFIERLNALQRDFSYNSGLGSLIVLHGRNADRQPKLEILYNGYSRVWCPSARKSVLTHRVAWELFYEEPAPKTVDHINGDKLDFKISNLREATQAENVSHRWSTLGQERFKGTFFCREYDNWRAGIGFNRKDIYLGKFNDPHHAAHAYNKAAICLHGEFAVLNPVGECPRGSLAAKLGGSNE